jgi:hypothetical protein
VDPGRQRGREGEGAQLRLGRTGPGAAHAGRGEVKRGPREKGKHWAVGWAAGKGRREGPERRREKGWVGLAGLSSLFLLLSFFFSILKLFKQNYFNSKKFEFKPYKLNTRKTMLQHECTNMLTL